MAVSLVLIGFDLNARFGGFIGVAIEWVRIHVLSEYPSLSVILGMFACYYLVLRGRGSFRDGG